jgi:hypothetical protein
MVEVISKVKPYRWAGTYEAKMLWGSEFHSIPPFMNRGIGGKLDPLAKWLV